MAVLSPVAANVTTLSSGTLPNGVSGEALTAGMVVFKDTDNKFYSASASSDGDMTGKTVGICLNPASAADKRAVVATTAGDEIILGCTVTKGTWYCIDETTGILGEYSDLSSSSQVCFVGYGSENSNLVLQITPTGFTK